MPPDDDRWYRWAPPGYSVDGYTEDEDLFAEVADAVENFESVDSESGRAATQWLKDEALDDYPSTVTWLVRHENGRVRGFYAICSAEILLSGRQRHGLRRRSSHHVLHPRQGASLIAWIARSADRSDDGVGRLLALHAVWTAQEVAKRQGNIALAVDPFDEGTSRFWQERYGFRKSSNSPSGPRQGRLWLPVHEAEDDDDDDLS